MLTENDIKAELSYSYLHAVAAHAGCRTTKVDPDRDSTDALIEYKGKLDEESILRYVPIKFQLKSTAEQPTAGTDGSFPYALKMKNYNDLRERSLVPCLLAVLFMPPERDHWVKNDQEQLVAKKCLYWCNLLGQPEVRSQYTTTVYIPPDNVLNSVNLKKILVKISKREEIGSVL